MQLYTVDSREFPAPMGLIDSDFFRADGHCSLSPDGKYVLYDSYPNGDVYRRLYLYDRVAQLGT